jgi:5'-nucleotidase
MISMNRRPRILLTNDDGITAPGIKRLWEALHRANFAVLIVIAPATEKSGAGVGITWNRPIQITRADWPEDTLAWSVDGTPADCVKMGLRIILKNRPDFIISGINAGSNAGRNVLHSGTVGAVIEGVFRGIPGMALSCENGDTPNYHVAEKYVDFLARYLMKHPLSPGCFLNINFPHCVQDRVKGFKITKQGKGRWSEDPSLHLETDLGSSYWLGGKPEELAEEDDCDISLLKEGYMTAVPVFVHDLTDLKTLEERKLEFENFFSEMPSC